VSKKKTTTGYATTSMNPQVQIHYPAVLTLPTGPGTCESCGHFQEEEPSDRGPCGECRLNPPYLASDYLTRRGPIRRYPVVLSNTPACSYHRPKAA
jgi:hypothetical protein